MLLLCHGAYAQSAAELLQRLEKLRVLGSVLYVAAHPDDENTKLIARWAQGDHYETAYLSLTRGDGGQNLIGTELGPELGLIRTNELLQARRIDGGAQYFSRANDFGFSKNPDETLRIWDREAVLADTVWVIRSFRPDVMVTRFSPQPSTTHGHHTASAQLAVEAFQAAADPSRFPEQLDHVDVWQPRRLLWNVSNFRQSEAEAQAVKADAETLVSGYSALLGTSYPQMAARSRSQHKSQGFGSAASVEEQKEKFVLLAGDRPEGTLFQGIDTTWSRLGGSAERAGTTSGPGSPGAAIIAAIDEIIANFRPLAPYQSVPALLQLREQVAELPRDQWAERKTDEIDALITGCLGLQVDANSNQPMTEPGGRAEVTFRATQRSPLAVILKTIDYGKSALQPQQILATDRTLTLKETLEIAPAGAFYTHPYWLREQPSEGMNVVAQQQLRGLPLAPEQLAVVWNLEVQGAPLRLHGPLTHSKVDPVQGEQIQAVTVAPPLSVVAEDELLLWPDQGAKEVAVRVRALQRPIASAQLRLDTPAGWTVTPSSVTFDLNKSGAEKRFIFSVTPPQDEQVAYLRPQVSFEGKILDRSLKTIDYAHLPKQVLQPQAQLKAVRLRLARSGQRIGYIAGAGDKIAEGLRQMGYQVDILPSDVSQQNLQGYDAVVLGVRAFNVLDDIEALAPKLFEYAQQGGTLVVNYNTNSNLKRKEIAPFPLELSRDRVTNERSEVRILAPRHPVLTTPNLIVESDFGGWVQERGLYFASKWDPAFTPILACHDPGESDLSGGLLVADYGKGHLVYTSYSFFRQLPAGVPGAYRLFANLVSLGSNKASR
jgi:LmbE family N-acetylglucosaminyl deacetylase